MARGYPDFFGQSIFPYFGPTNIINDAGFSTGGADVIINLVGKGVFLGGTIYVNDNDDPPVSIFEIAMRVDGGDNLRLRTFRLDDREYGWNFPCMGREVYWNLETREFVYLIDREISFGVSFELWLGAVGYAGAPDWDVKGAWAQII